MILRAIWIRAACGLLLFLAVPSASHGQETNELADWTMVNVNETDKQGDAHLLKLPDGKLYLIDTGDIGAYIVPFLRAKGIHRIDKVLISHMHHDHYGALLDIMEAGIRVREVRLNVPDPSICDREKPWGCDREDIVKTLAALKAKKVPVKPLRAGDVLFHGGGSDLRVIYAFDGIHTPIGKTDVNDTSVLMLLKHGQTRVLFTGDLNIPLGTWLAKNGKSLRAEILKVAHHGTEGTAPNEFVDAVGPRVALIPSPKKLWLSDRSKRLRTYFAEKNVDTYINGLQGNVFVNFSSGGFSIQTERGPGSEKKVIYGN